MRAVNLLPQDLRRAGSGGGSGSGAGAYALLAVLALLVALVSVWAYTGRQVKDREAEVTRVNAEAQAAETQAAGLASYESTVKVAQTRRAAVDEVLKGRNDWSARLNDAARTIPSTVTLTSMGATSSPAVAVDGGASNPLRAANAVPAIEIQGCALSQGDVAKLMSRLRAMKGVSNVGLSSTEKTEGGGPGGTSDSAAAVTNGDCTAGSDQRPKFNIVVFYGGDATAAPVAGGATTDAAATAATPAAPATPASSTTSSNGSTK